MALFIGLTWSIIRQYGSLVVSLFVLAGLGLVVALFVPIVLVHAIRASVTTTWRTRHTPERRVRPLLPFVLIVISLIPLLVLWLSAPVVLNQLLGQQGLATAGVVVGSADHHAAEAVLEQTGSFSHAEVYLTTQVKPLAVNGIPLAQILQAQQPGPGQNNDLQVLINKFMGLQGYDLAHRPFLNTMAFAPEWGHGGPGPSGSGTGPYGRLLNAHDAGTFNVLIPRDFGGLSYQTYNGDTITVQSLVTRQTFGLHVVGEYEPDGSARTPLFGRVLADDSVVQTLSGGQPSYAYGLHLDGNQIPMVFAHLHTRVPTAQLYNFLTGPTGSDTRPAYALFTNPDPGPDPNPASILGDNNVPRSPLFEAIAAFWALLLAMFIVLNSVARPHIAQRGLGNRHKC